MVYSCPVQTFESEAAIADYFLSSLPWLLMTVYTLDGKHNAGTGAGKGDAGASEEDKRLRMSFAAAAAGAAS